MKKQRIFCITYKNKNKNKNNSRRDPLFGTYMSHDYLVKDTEWLPEDFNKCPLSYSYDYVSHKELLGVEYTDYLWNTGDQPFNAKDNSLREEILCKALTKAGFTIPYSNSFQTPCKNYIISLIKNHTWYDLRVTLSGEHPHFNVLNTYGKIPSVLVGHWIDEGGTIEAAHEYHSVNELYNRIIFVTRTIDDILPKI